MARSNIFIKDDIIWVQVKGQVSIEDAKDIAEVCVPLLERHKSVLDGGIIDLTEADNADTKARKELAESLKKCDGYLGKVAVYSPDLKKRVIAKIVLTMGGYTNFKTFNRKNEAIDWIKGK
jgi:hypothetical protein